MTNIKTSLKHFIDLDQIPELDLKQIITIAKKLKSFNRNNSSLLLPKKFLDGKNLAMIFEKTSTRTRVSFEVAINQLGGNAIVMNKNDMQLGKGETISDTAKVLSRFVDLVMIRCKEHSLLLEMANNSSVPIINALSDFSHPCQIMASILTIEEHLGDLSGLKLAWFGDANNVLNSYIHAAKPFGYELNIALPQGFNFCDFQIAKARAGGAKIYLTHDPRKAADSSDVLITDTWISMGEFSDQDQQAKKEKIKLLAPYQVNDELVKLAKKDVIFTHCLPAYRGYEVAESVIDSDKSVVFDEAENRLHIQKAIMMWLFDLDPQDL